MIIHQPDGSFRASYDVTEKITHDREFYAAILVSICTANIPVAVFWDLLLLSR